MLNQFSPNYQTFSQTLNVLQTFSCPNQHPKSKPFVDHVLTFSIADGRVWFRNFQILEENGELVEIGNHFVSLLNFATKFHADKLVSWRACVMTSLCHDKLVSWQACVMTSLCHDELVSWQACVGHWNYQIGIFALIISWK